MIAAETAAATYDLMAQYGWSNAKQAELYTKGADQIENELSRTSNKSAG